MYSNVFLNYDLYNYLYNLYNTKRVRFIFLYLYKKLLQIVRNFLLISLMKYDQKSIESLVHH